MAGSRGNKETVTSDSTTGAKFKAIQAVAIVAGRAPIVPDANMMPAREITTSTRTTSNSGTAMTGRKRRSRPVSVVGRGFSARREEASVFPRSAACAFAAARDLDGPAVRGRRVGRDCGLVFLLIAFYFAMSRAELAGGASTGGMRGGGKNIMQG